MGLLDWLFSKSEKETQSQATAHELYTHVREARPVEHIATPSNFKFDLSAFQRAAQASYSRPSTKAMAVAAAKVALLIEENFDTQQIKCMVQPSLIAPYADTSALPIHFLFMQGDTPRVALVIVTADGYKTPRVLTTKSICEKSGIEYLRVYATGTYADWITGNKMDGEPVSAETVEKCKQNIIERIKKALG